MDAIEKVFCATDFSEASDEAIRQADQLAREHKAKLLVYHAMPSAIGSHPLLPQLDTQATADLPALQAQILDSLSERVMSLTGRGEDDVQVQVGEGEPYAAIVSRAEAAGADLIVVGGQRASGLKRLLIGDVAERVVRYAHCPVLVARPGPKAARILVATDFSDPALPAVAAAADQARLRSARVTIVHSLDLPDIAASQPRPDLGALIGGGGPPEPVRTELHKAAEERLASAIARFNLPADPVVTDGHPATDIPRLAADLPADLVVVATSGRTGIRRVMLGSVAEAIVRASPCSVLVVRLKSGGHQS
ncbi:MAG: universal stress protein [Polyangiaceae bacterium]|nr:universal stress protein [Polyangiaceae bacterium]NUQ72095.1 universal stress protein [Polyangiaceae bacterium]